MLFYVLVYIEHIEIWISCSVLLNYKHISKFQQFYSAIHKGLKHGAI